MKEKSLLQFLKFALVGVSNTLVSQLTYMACIALGMHYLAANIIGFVISVLNAFFWQTRFVFKEDENAQTRVWWQVLLKTYAAYAFTGLLLNNLLLIVWIDLIRIENYTLPLTQLINSVGIGISNSDLAKDIAPLLNMVVNVPINFVINKFWAYRQKSKDNQS
ncbi:MAG: GtrA family protein [Oscillospiraceae bacterium]